MNRVYFLYNMDLLPGDDNEIVRDRAVKFIERLRENNTPTAAQDFVLPEINLEAQTYHKLITWKSKDGSAFYFKASAFHGKAVHNNLSNRRVTEPPLTRDMSVAELYSFILKPLKTEFLCHSQPCERGVKLTSDSCRNKTNYNVQLGLALSADNSRKKCKEITALKESF